MPALFRDLFCSDPGIRASGIRQCFVIYFALILVSELPGYASPLYWVLCPVVAAFLGAGPLTCVMNMGKGIGGAAVLPVLWFIVMKLMGEFSMPLMIIGMLCMIILAEVVRGCVGYEKKSSIRAATPFLSLIVFASFLPLYFQTAAYSGNAMAEMGAEYGAKIASYGNFGMFLLVLVLSVIEDPEDGGTGAAHLPAQLRRPSGHRKRGRRIFRRPLIVG